MTDDGRHDDQLGQKEEPDSPIEHDRAGASRLADVRLLQDYQGHNEKRSDQQRHVKRTGDALVSRLMSLG